jgi:hypothetical protein
MLARSTTKHFPEASPVNLRQIVGPRTAWRAGMATWNGCPTRPGGVPAGAALFCAAVIEWRSADGDYARVE